MSKFGNIYSSWRKGTGHKRHVVGVIKSNSTKGVSFEYLPKAKLENAISDGFISYTEFPNLEKIYTDNVSEIFQQRLFRSERSDYKDFLDFWGIPLDKKDDTLYLLAHTQGIVPTDNFEFLADFKVTKELKFVSEICGLTYSKVQSDKISIGEEIFWKKNASSKFDKYQVDLYTKDKILLGHVKKVHSRIFYNSRVKTIKIHVKALDKNGVLKRAFIEIG